MNETLERTFLNFSFNDIYTPLFELKPLVLLIAIKMILEIMAHLLEIIC